MSSKSDPNECCNIISKSVKEIIRWSVNDNFRNECFKLLEVNNSFEAEIKVKEKLMEINNSLSLKPKAQQRKPRKKPYDKDAETSTSRVSVIRTEEKATLTKSEIDGKEVHQWDLGDVNVDEIDNWD